MSNKLLTSPLARARYDRKIALNRLNKLTPQVEEAQAIIDKAEAEIARLEGAK